MSSRTRQAGGGAVAEGRSPSADSYQESVVRSKTVMHEVIEAVVTAMADQSFPQKDQFGMRLVLEEALVNALTHGCQGDPTKQVCVRYRVDAQRALAEIEDEGEGFDPQQVPDPLAPENLERPCGRGLLLMRSYATWVRHNRRGNCVTLCKVRSS